MRADGRQHVDVIQSLLGRVRSRWRRRVLLQCAVSAALAVSGVLAAGLLLSAWASRHPLVLVALAASAITLAIVASAWGFRPMRTLPSDNRLARFIEEREPSLDDRLVSAVDVIASGREPAASLTSAMLADAARSVSSVDAARMISDADLRRAGLQAFAAACLLVGIGVGGRHVIRQSFDAAVVTLFPSRFSLQVEPGDVRIQAGSPLVIAARLSGNRSPLGVQLLRTENGKDWHATDMTSGAPGAFRLALDAVRAPFKYRVVASNVTSSTFDVTVARAPRVTRIDVDYTYPKGLGLAPRHEEDGGDIYAPAGTEARLRIQTDPPAASGQLALSGGSAIALSAGQDAALAAVLKVAEDTSYRVALADREGLKSTGETEYFVRVLADGPPDVHITKPARDKSVTALEEVDIQAQADDDYGVARMELVYDLRGTKKIVPLGIPQQQTSVTANYTLYLEDLGVKPGDFVSYYVRAHDVARGKASNEARSNLFFLDVKPFEREFTLGKNQGNGSGSSLDDLVSAQKEVVVATWKLDRRSEGPAGAKPEGDIRSVGNAEAELKGRVEQMSSSFRESTMRDPRLPGRGGAPKAGETLPEEDAIGAAVKAMGQAVTSLGALNTSGALPPELEALDHLLKAQGDVKKREISNQQAGTAATQNRSNEDASTLFDKELKRQQTNYETRTDSEPQDNRASMLDKIRDLAKRQDELNRQQQDLARRQAQLTPEEQKRELERLTREQSDLRQRAEDLARQMNDAKPQDQQAEQQADQKSGQPGGGQQSGGSQQAAGGQQRGGSGQPRPGQSESAQSGRQMRDVSDEMRSAAGELRRQDPAEASERGVRALSKLQALEQQLQKVGPNEPQRQLGEMQLEARQLADAERRAAAELAKAGQGAPQDAAGQDALRRLAGDQERLAARAGRVQEGLKQAAAAGGAAKGAATPEDKSRQQTAAQASRDAERQRLASRMQEAADAIRDAGQSGAAPRGGSSAKEKVASTAAAEAEIARALDKLADSLANPGTPRDEGTQKLADQRVRAQDLHAELNRLSDEVKKLEAQTQQGGARSGQPASGSSGRQGQGQAGGGAGGSDLAQLREEYRQQLQQTDDLMKQLRRDDPSFAQGAAGFTFDGQGMVLSAPGTEAFKQDFARWQQLQQQATAALEHAENTLSQKLREKEARDHLAAGSDDKAPGAYQTQVDSYFKALAGKKK